MLVKTKNLQRARARARVCVFSIYTLVYLQSQKRACTYLGSVGSAGTYPFHISSDDMSVVSTPYTAMDGRTQAWKKTQTTRNAKYSPSDVSLSNHGKRFASQYLERYMSSTIKVPNATRVASVTCVA